MTLEYNAICKIFEERKNFIIIGLTGRTGCGCSTVANFLCKDFKSLQPPEALRRESIEDREYSIIYNYAKETWTPFRLIEMKHVIFTFILEYDFDEFLKYIDDFVKNDFDLSDFSGRNDLLELSENYHNLHEKRIYWRNEVSKITERGENVPAGDDIYRFYFEEIPKLYKEFQSKLPANIYTKLLQSIGNNIRKSGCALSCEDCDPDNILKLAQRVNMLIKILRRKNIEEKKRVLVVIDALRNPYEATFFKDRYSAFYLFAVNSTDKERIERLVKKGLNYQNIQSLDEEEYPSLNNTINDFYKINIEKTIEIADVHINNPQSDSNNCTDTKKQIIRYISLIMHPGLVTPTPLEYCMQVAYNSKLNSGCLSRQVGAAISDCDYNILSTGWNNTPQGQVPCNLRSLFSIVREDNDDNIGISLFENTNDEYRTFLRERVRDIDFSLLDGRYCSYCFKDAYNAFTKKKNQVHTRSIHAEEMAFLQSAKIGNNIVKNGYLFTTASPCELCSKKAYHTGIKKIFYIDKYPGISYEHILNCGESIPEMIPFQGAIGRAYQQFYTQILPYKDELYMLLGLTFKTNK